MTKLEEVDQIIDEIITYRALVRKGHDGWRDRDSLEERLREFITKLREQNGMEG